jgi:beta-N-acetylhexosaminidase
MTLPELVGSVLLPHVYGSSATEVTPAQAAANRALLGVDTPAQAVARWHLAGFTLVEQNTLDPDFGWLPTGNVETPAQLAGFTSGLQAAAHESGAPAPLLIATDQEGGTVERLTDGATWMPAEQAFGAAANPTLTRTAGATVGAELSATGVNVALAPVADVTARPGNTVIATRSFGANPSTVSTLVAAEVTGLQSAGIAATVKHFPGHGNSDVDSHQALPVLTQSAASLAAVDLPPFEAAIRDGVDVVMVGHLLVQAVDANYPASLSHAVVTGLLRDKLHYQGVIVTDALGMGALRDRYGVGQVAVLALAAGDDLLGMPANTVAAASAITSAVQTGQLPVSVLRAAATRVMRLRLALAKAWPAPLSDVGSAAHQAVAAQAAADAVTDLGLQCTPPHLTSATLVGTDSVGISRLAAALIARGVRVGSGPVVNVVGNDPAAAAAASAVTVATATPYALSSSSSPVRLAAYGDDPVAIGAVADVLSGRTAPEGTLPVPVSGASTCR